MPTASKKSPQASNTKRSRMTPADRTTEILNAAVRLVLSDGTSRMTMDAVAQEAGVSKALVYTYFPSSISRPWPSPIALSPWSRPQPTSVVLPSANAS